MAAGRATRACSSTASGSATSLSPGEFSNFVPDTGATQEVAVDYGAVSAEQAFGGLRINLDPKEGGNSFKGRLFATGVNSAWQSDNLTEELKDRGLPAPNEMKRAYDINPSFGGPIMRDQLWFFASARCADEPELHRRALLQRERGRSDQVDCMSPTRADQAVLLDHAEGRQRPLTWQATPEAQALALLRQPEPHLGRQRAPACLAGVGRRLPVPDAAPGAGGLDVAGHEPAAARGALREPRRGVRQPAPT